MSYPQQNIPYNQFLNYVNTEWVTNAEGDIDAVIGNNVVNALYQYITKSYLNWNKATIFSSGGIITLSNAVNVITNTLPTSLQWADNVYNEYVIINTKTSSIPLANGFIYYSLANTAVTSIPANSVLVIYKLTNGNWIQGNYLNIEGLRTATQLAIAVNGESGSPIAGENNYQNDVLIGATGLYQLTINKQIFYIQNDVFTQGDYIFDNETGTITFLNYYWYGGDQSVLNFNKLN